MAGRKQVRRGSASGASATNAEKNAAVEPSEATEATSAETETKTVVETGAETGAETGTETGGAEAALGKPEGPTIDPAAAEDAVSEDAVGEDGVSAAVAMTAGGASEAKTGDAENDPDAMALATNQPSFGEPKLEYVDPSPRDDEPRDQDQADADRDAAVAGAAAAGVVGGAAMLADGSAARSGEAVDDEATHQTNGAPPITPSVIGGVLGAVVGAALVFGGLAISGALGGGVDAAQVAALNDKLAAVETRLTGAEAERAALSEAQTGVAAAAAAAQERIDTLAADFAERDKATAGAIVALGNEVETLRGTPPAGLEGAAGAERIDMAAINDLSARLDALAGRLAAVEETRDGSNAPGGSGLVSADPAALIALDDRITDLEAQVATLTETPPAGEAALGVAFAALAEGVASAQPYADAVATFEKVSGQAVDPAISGPAEAGLANRVGLATRFDAASRGALLGIAEHAAETGDVTSRIGGVLSGMVVVRRTDAYDAQTPEGVLARADAKLAEGALADALTILEDLPEPGRAAMADWLKDAETRAAAEAALDGLRKEMLGAN